MKRSKRNPTDRILRLVVIGVPLDQQIVRLDDGTALFVLCFPAFKPRNAAFVAKAKLPAASEKQWSQAGEMHGFEQLR
jgi:hypothetical protein